MLNNALQFRNIIAFSVLALAVTSCAKNDDAPEPLRPRIEYATLTATTPYPSAFQANGQTTVDLKNGNNRNKMFQAINSVIGSATTANKEISPTVLKNMLSNTGNPFVDSAFLNTSGVQLRNVISSSRPAAEAEADRVRLEALFTTMGEISKSATQTASKGKAGKLGTRLVDAKGIETVQIIQKSLIGALQYDYIANVLFKKVLVANNTTLVSGKNYTEMEQAWDEAFGLLTLNKVYLLNSTDGVRGTTEFGLGSYTWEYNKADYPKMQLAFLKGRAAIVNNDKTELQSQIDFIKAAFEKAIAAAAVGYMGKANTGNTDADRAHALGEGLGFVYSLRYCEVNGGTAAFSDGLLLGLVGSEFGYWDLTPAKTAAAAAAITTKFKL